METVWKDLNHDVILHQVEVTVGEKLSNLLLKRNSYINRVYELEKHDSRERIIVKFYRPGRWTAEMILEEHRFLKDLAQKEISVIPPLPFSDQTLFNLNSIPYALMPKKGGRPLNEFDKDTWEELGRLLARIHLTGALHNKANRLVWRPSSATRAHLKVLKETDYLLPDFHDAFFSTAEKLIEKARPLFDRQEYILIHGDCHKGNLLHRPGEGIYIVDFDDISLGPPVQDLWMLLPDEIENCSQELEWFRKGYETFRAFDINSLELIPALRAMRIIHFAAWLAVQSKEPDFSVHFPHAGTKRYWSELIRDLQEIVFNIF
ncbi:MAG: serine/threonine protein kinase [Candidatus Saganbacteria bacterium]|nr:serine/threonine protein kinase [Candidatus Saganbacteria bacterium]